MKQNKAFVNTDLFHFNLPVGPKIIIIIKKNLYDLIYLCIKTVITYPIRNVMTQTFTGFQRTQSD